MENNPGDITRLLLELKQGNRQAEEMLFDLIYKDLRRKAAGLLRRERAGHTLQPTALVHEAYLRLTQMQKIDWQSRNQFFAIAAKVMQHILVDHARGEQAQKRGDGILPVSFDEATVFSPQRPDDLIALDDALSELALIWPRKAKIVQMRFFSGMTEEEIGSVHGIASRTVKRDWRIAKDWLYHRLSNRA